MAGDDSGGDVRTLLLTDLVDSTRLIEQLGDQRAGELMAEHARLARALLEPHCGREIDKTDGFLLLFEQAIDALRYALSYHAKLCELSVDRGLTIAARAGMHAGPVVLQQAAAEDVARGAKPLDVEGIAKPLAARVMSLAGPGQTLLSADAYASVTRAVDAGQGIADGAVAVDHGLYALKGVELPVGVIEIGVEGVAPLSPPADAAKAYRVVALADGGFRPARDIANNLPRALSSFIGRGAELQELTRKFDEGAPLVTVLGPGGIGKTRLAGRYALTRLGDYPGGAWYCELADARTLDEVLAVVASALGVVLSEDDPIAQLGHAIAGREVTLIVLDNFEQIVEHAAATLGCWMRRAECARFVVTSRELLQLEGERSLPVGPLSTPTSATLEGLRASEAAALFAERARAVLPSFELTDSNVVAVAEVVELLDGLPLAIELAAARIRMLPPAKIVERLSMRFALLRGKGRDRSARQSTLRGAIDWSWELCAPWERLALAQCSVFRGGFDLEAAEAVVDTSAWEDAPWPMDVVQALVDKSLVHSWKPEDHAGRFEIDEPLFGLYLSVQAYAAEKLRDPSSVAAPDGSPATGPEAALETERRHGRWYARVGRDEAIEELHGADARRARSRLALERQNIAVALERAVAREDEEVTGSLALAFTPASEGNIRGAAIVEVLKGVLEGVELEPPTRVKVLCQLGYCAAQAGHDADDIRRTFGQAIGLAQQLGDGRLHARALIDSAALGPAGERYLEAIAVLQDARPMAEQAADTRYVVRADRNLAVMHALVGQRDAARVIAQRCVEGARQTGDRRTESQALLDLAIHDHLDGRLDESLRGYRAVADIARREGHRYLAAHATVVIADHHEVTGKASEAKRTAIEALSMLRPLGIPRSEGIARYVLSMAHLQLGELEQAEARIAEAIAALAAVDRNELCMALGCRARIEQARGDDDVALATLAEAESLIADLGVGAEAAPALRIAAARAAIDRGEHRR